MTEFRTEKPPPPDPNRPVVLRHMRVETDFRRATYRLERRERDKYASFVWNLIRMEGKPKVSILDVVGARGDNIVNFEHEDPLKTTVDYYRGKEDRFELVQVVKYYTVYLMQQARKEPSVDKQLFLIFKAVEFARMIVQYSSYSINADAEAIVFGVFHDLGDQKGGRFRTYIEHEQTIFTLMKRLHRSPLDNDARMEMAEAMIKQSSYYDAMAQFQFLLTRYPRVPAETDGNRGRVFVKIAEVFQGLIDFAEENPEGFRDGRKLKNFIERYNRDFPERKHRLHRITSATPSQLRLAVRSLRTVANLWYQRALGVRVMGPRMVTRLVSLLATNFMRNGQGKEALKVLDTGYKFWRGIREGKEIIEQRLEYLELMASVGSQLKNKTVAEFATREIREFKNRLIEIEKQAQEEEARKAALLEGEEYSP